MREQNALISIPKDMAEGDAAIAVLGTFERMGYAGSINGMIWLQDVRERRARAGDTHFAVGATITFEHDVSLPERLDVRWVKDVNICWGERIGK